MATPIAIPTPSHALPLPRATASAAPIPAPSAIPNPICIDGRLIVIPRQRGVPHPSPFFGEGGEFDPYLLPPLAGGSASGLGALSPMPRTLLSNSVILIPDNDSNNAGTCAAIFAKSPVILFIPVASPLPVETTVILSTLASGAAIALTTSGKLVSSLS